ncbi:hypothetical protein SAMN05421766_101577 [Zobellia uliginosa]|uniref:GLPGLI family protein n=1 Tax=Zobellia uliginosa TaxID=143224 RepID=A0ABY1KMQ7_9FLAO|nr:hypothetical protein [Zobellia uliginosa]SIS40361.1 hypothetical protein SAMN05421766_101577 [Zobellia uliginosa]
MKIKLIYLLILLYAFTVQGQKENLGIVVEYTAPIDLTFQTYDPPLKIKKTTQKEGINYKEIEGLLQSFFSASDMEWALSDYLAKNATTSRDESHFETIKKSMRIKIISSWKWFMGSITKAGRWHMY